MTTAPKDPYPAQGSPSLAHRLSKDDTVSENEYVSKLQPPAKDMEARKRSVNTLATKAGITAAPRLYRAYFEGKALRPKKHQVERES